MPLFPLVCSTSLWVFSYISRSPLINLIKRRHCWHWNHVPYRIKATSCGGWIVGRSFTYLQPWFLAERKAGKGFPFVEKSNKSVMAPEFRCRPSNFKPHSFILFTCKRHVSTRLKQWTTESGYLESQFDRVSSADGLGNPTHWNFRACNYVKFSLLCQLIWQMGCN